MLHRAIFGSLERFFGVLIENTAGDFPLWIAPTQLRLVPVIDSVRDYCFEVKRMAEKMGIRCEVDNSGQRLAKAVRTAEQEKIPVVAVVGEKEQANRELSIRLRKGGDLGAQALDAILLAMQSAIKDSLELDQVPGLEKKPSRTTDADEVSL
jgi:threonyl-tRNA synthetase